MVALFLEYADVAVVSTANTGGPMLLKMFAPRGIAHSAQKVVRQSPKLSRLLSERGIELQIIPWDGEAATLPTDEPVIVLVTIGFAQVLGERWEGFTKWCASVGHLVYLGNDVTILPSGEVESTDSTEHMRRFLDSFVAVVH